MEYNIVSIVNSYRRFEDVYFLDTEGQAILEVRKKPRICFGIT
jgi:hypothetical protein